MPKPVLPLIVHEFSPNGQHRIIRHYSSGGLPEVGNWAEPYQLAILGNLLANSGELDHLPLGVFVTKVIAHHPLA